MFSPFPIGRSVQPLWCFTAVSFPLSEIISRDQAPYLQLGWWGWAAVLAGGGMSGIFPFQLIEIQTESTAALAQRFLYLGQI